MDIEGEAEGSSWMTVNKLTGPMRQPQELGLKSGLKSRYHSARCQQACNYFFHIRLYQIKIF